jgi:hypothetical protein
MNKKIIIINGSGKVGKDTFIELVSKYISTTNYSSVDKVKRIARLCDWTGEWYGDKTEEDRKFLSDLKILVSDYSDLPFKDMEMLVKDFKENKIETELLFLHIREPLEIARAKREFNAITLLVKRDGVKPITSNMADANVENYLYDFIIYNNGILEELEEKAKVMVENMRYEN